MPSKNKNIELLQNINKETNKETDKEINKETDKETDKEINKEINKETNKEINNEINKETNKETNKEMNNETNKEINKEINKETNKETDKEINKETNKEMNKELNMDIYKEMNKELDKEMNMDMNKETNMDINMELNMKQEEIDIIFINLRLITKIEIGNKIYIDNKFINIDNSYCKPLTRWYYDINRYDNLNFVKKIINNAFLLNDELISKYKENTSFLNRLNNELKFSINGMLNYKQTYITDKLFQSEIDVLIENIRNKIEKNNKLLN